MSRKKKDGLEEQTEFGASVDTEEDFGLAALEADAPDNEHVDLTAAEKKKLEAEARKEAITAIKAAKAKEFKAQVKKQVQAQVMFQNGKDDTGEDLDEVHLHLASYPKWITLDGQRYYSGRKYKKRRAVIAVLKDQMDRGWRQEAARTGEKVENFSPVRYAAEAGLRYISA